MRITLEQKKGTWRLSDMDELHLSLLRQAGEDASMTDCPEGRARLLPKPVSAKDEGPEEDLLEDWAEYVVGELDTQFASDVGILLNDLDAALPSNLTDSTDEDEVLFELEVPIDHGQAWFSALNQARLMLDIKFKLHPDGRDFEPDELQDVLGEVDTHERLGAYMRYEFFALVQEWLVRHTL